MTLPKSKFLHRPANPGACVLDIYHEMHMHSIVEPTAPSLTMEMADLTIEHAVSTTSRLFGFWRAIQKTGIDLGNINNHWRIYKGVGV